MLHFAFDEILGQLFGERIRIGMVTAQHLRSRLHIAALPLFTVRGQRHHFVRILFGRVDRLLDESSTVAVAERRRQVHVRREVFQSFGELNRSFGARQIGQDRLAQRRLKLDRGRTVEDDVHGAQQIRVHLGFHAEFGFGEVADDGHDFGQRLRRVRGENLRSIIIK